MSDQREAAPAGPEASEPEIGLPVSTALRILDDWLNAGRLDEAERLLGRIAAAMPDLAGLGLRRAVLAGRRKLTNRAMRLARAAIDTGETHPELFRIVYDLQVQLGNDRGAVTTARQALTLQPDDPNAWARLADALYRHADPEAAIAACDKALALDAENIGARSVRAEALLLLGRFAEGWADYPWRLRRPRAVTINPSPPEWDGTRRADWPNRASRLLIYGDQGMGDVIQFIRYLPFVVERWPGEHVVLACAAQLHPLLRPYLGRVAPGMEMVALGAPTPAVAAMLPLSVLPGLAGTRLETIPGPSPYLYADPALAAAWRARLDARLPRERLLRVGLIWSGNPQQSNNPIRAVPLAHLAPLTALDGIALVALQKGAAAEAQLQAYSGRAPLISVGPELNDFADTAACLAGLDLLVATDTGPVHLAGALGVPTFLMLAHAADWRWLRERSDSPWYPSLRLFRQPTPGAWDKVVTEVTAAVAALASASSSSVPSAPRNGA